MKAYILRDRTSKKASLEIELGPGASPASALGPAWELFSGARPESIDYSAPVLRGRGPGSFAAPADPARRVYYALRAEGFTGSQGIILAESRLPMRGGYNFRDLGGLRTPEGHSLVWGKVFRSDGLDELCDEDLEYLASIPVTTVLDFRTESERNRALDRLPPGLKQCLHWPIFPGSLSYADFANAETPAESRAVMCRMYELFVSEEPILEHYRNFFRLLEDEGNLPLFFHCSAGKDRTGLAAALFLFALGVEREAIMRDYLVSAEYLEGKYPPGQDFYSVRPEYLEAALAVMERRSGTVENFLAEVLGVDLAKLRERYLTRA